MARLKTPISYYGGKQMLLKHILPLIPEHTLYTEAFCGGCAVLFAKPPAQCEVINDTNTELVNFYRVVQMQYAALKAMIDGTFGYDCPEAFHFVDPPYVGSDCGHYNGTFDEEDFSRLLDTLATVEGKFMLTMFPHEEIERLAARHGWTIHRLDRTISASKVSRRRQEEWITTNY